MMFSNFFKLVLVLIFLVSCKSGHIQADSYDRLPSAEVNQIDDGLVQLAGEIRTHLSEVGNPRIQLLGFFAASGRRVLLNKELSQSEKQSRILALFKVYESLVSQSDISFWLGREEKSIQNKLDLLTRKFEGVAQKQKISPQHIVGASISYMRFISNRITTSITNLNSGPQYSLNTQKQINNLRNSYSSIPNKLAVFSTFQANLPKLVSELEEVTKSSTWQALVSLSQSMYLSIRDSSDILGSDSEIDNVISIKIGPKALDLLFENTKELAEQMLAQKTSAYVEFPLIELNTIQPMQAPSVSRKIASTENSAALILIGLIPAQYFNKKSDKYVFGYVEIENRIIKSMKIITKPQIESVKKQFEGRAVLELKRNNKYDVIYPGLIDLHDHTKQNNLPVWGLAKGQFENRFEWRDWDAYTKSVSQNMNPWIQYGKPIECAAFRWSELQAMVVGTTYLQGPSSCVEGFGIQRVEDRESYISSKSAVQAPTDIIVPNDFVFVWQTLKPIIETGKTYEEAIAQVVGQYCPNLQGQINPKSVSTSEGLEILKNQELLKKECPDTIENPLPAKFVRYLYWVHSGIAGRKKYLNDPSMSAVIAHVAEGRRTDAYNMKEYEILKLLGLNKPGMVFVHGVGITPQHLNEMGRLNIGVVWSPFSNLILYGETLDILEAHKAGVRMSLGSDWLPTGTKGPLEEVKVAAAYVDKDLQKENLKKIFTDEYLYKMMTENPAKMIGHYQISKTEAGVGRLAVGAMGSVLVATLKHHNPHTNLVRHILEEDINLVVIDGRPIYGNTEYLDNLKLNYETLSKKDSVITDTVAFATTDKVADKTAPVMFNRMIEVAKLNKDVVIPVAVQCQFSGEKGYVDHTTVDEDIRSFETTTGYNLDRFSDIQRLLASHALTQSINKTFSDGDPSFSMTYFPSLYSCNDLSHKNRIQSQVQALKEDDWTDNLKRRADNRQGLGKLIETLKLQYK